MFRGAVKSFLRSALVVAVLTGGATAAWFAQHRQSESWRVAQLEKQKQKLEEEKHQLQTAVERLSDEKRVAEVLVTDQAESGGQLKTTLLFVEYGRDGASLPPKTFTIEGNSAHIDALVIKFDRGLIAANDPLRGHSVALFRPLFGDTQPPEKGFTIDEPGQIPTVYRGDPKTPPAQIAFERDLWQNFWRLAEDKTYRAEKGVRVANGQGIWGPFAPDRLYTVTLDSDGGLNLASEPLKGIYREAMKQRLTRSE